MNLRAVSSTTF